MNRITKKLIKYMFFILTIAIMICFFIVSIFLSKFYLGYQYNILKNNAENIYNDMNSGLDLKYINYSGVIIKDSQLITLGKKRTGIIHYIKSIENDLSQKGKFKTPMNESFIYYKLDTNLGKIIVFESLKSSQEYLNLSFFILIIIFFCLLILSIPYIYIWGKKITNPILDLKKLSSDISNDVFDTKLNINTDDEIEDLYISLKNMSAKLENKYKLQNEFISNVSHDFKTPLSIIRNYSEAISDKIIDYDTCAEYSKEIIKEVDKLNSLVMDLLSLSKLKEGKYKINKQHFNINDFLEEISTSFNKVASEKNITIKLDCDSVEVFEDPKHLYRVVYNLIDNAIKFSYENSHIDIFSTIIDNKKIKISIKDYGVGIKENDLKNIWNRYSKNKDSGGMGLGLTICSEIFRALKIDYGVNSKFENGSEFFFILNI